MNTQELEAKLEEERDHSAWLEKLLRVLYGDGWEKLTIAHAQAWHKEHFASHQTNTADAKHPCPMCKMINSGIHFYCSWCGRDLRTA